MLHRCSAVKPAAEASGSPFARTHAYGAGRPAEEGGCRCSTARGL